MTREPKVEYKVYYRANPEYDGDFNVPRKPGLHATLPLLHEAEDAEAKCRKWFTEEKVLCPKPQRDGSIVDEIKTVIHDNVIVWIEKHVDGFPVKEEEGSCDEQVKKSRKKEPATV